MRTGGEGRMVDARLCAQQGRLPSPFLLTRNPGMSKKDTCSRRTAVGLLQPISLTYNAFMAATINIDEIQRDLLYYLRRVQAGETLIITQADKPLAEIKPVSAEVRRPEQHLRPCGLARGEFVVPDDFD